MNLENYMLPCWSKTLFGVECLGCGLQRAFLLLLKGDFIGAFQMYPAIYVTLVFFWFDWFGPGGQKQKLPETHNCNLISNRDFHARRLHL